MTSPNQIPIFQCTEIQAFEALLPLIEQHISSSTQRQLEDAMISNGINGESLLFIDQKCLNEMEFWNRHNQNIILSAISSLYNQDVFPKYIASYTEYKSFEKHFIQSNVDLNTFRKNGHSNKWYQSIGIDTSSNMSLLINFKSTFNLFTVQLSCSREYREICKEYITISNFDHLQSRMRGNLGYIANEFGRQNYRNYNCSSNIYQYVYGEYVRVFWGDESSNVYPRRCDHSKCKNREFKGYMQRQKLLEESKYVCSNHPICIGCIHDYHSIIPT